MAQILSEKYYLSLMLPTKLKVFASKIAKIGAGKYHWPHKEYFPTNLWLKELQFTLQQKNDLSIHCMSLILKTDVMVQIKYVASIWQKKCVEETPVVFQGN